VPTLTTAPHHPRAAASERLTYSVEEAAALLGIGRGLAYEMVRDGSLPGLRLGQRRILVPRGALEALLGSSSMASATGVQSAQCR
jgi:excisionase family DNA binding protein